MSPTFVRTVVFGLFAVTGVAVCAGQPDFQRTKVVDPTSTTWANFNDIKAAIDSITPQAGQQWTVLIYPGVYTIDALAELIHLDGQDERISLVGVDRQSVIIKVTIDGPGIKITSGDETSRDCRIANLTIETTNGHGIEIVKGDTPVPKNITIDNVTIRATGSAKRAIDGPAASEVTISNCDVAAAEADGIWVGNNFTLANTIVSAAGSAAIYGETKSALRLRGCKLSAGTGGSGLNMQTSSNIEAFGCEIVGGVVGVNLWRGDTVRFEACTISAGPNPTAQPCGVFVDKLGEGVARDVVFLGCRISATTSTSNVAHGVAANTASAGVGELRFIDCAISAHSTSASGGPAYGVGDSGAITLIGGSITTGAAAERETEVFDLITHETPGLGTILVSGTNFSKWKAGQPIFAAGRPTSVIQRTINVTVPSPTGILPATALQATEQSITTGIASPGVYRVLSATGNTLGMNQAVYIIGTDFAGNAITDKITLNGTNTVDGVKPFMTVTKIILPGQTGSGQSVSVGTTSKLGLQFPISATSDVLQEGRKASTANSYTLENVGTVDTTSATIDVAPITANDSFEWAVLASQ